MNFQQYQDHFQNILSNSNPPAPYDHIDYFDYAKLNWARQQRWLKTAVLDPDLSEAIVAISKPQQWIVITEPWCGDASHTVPLIHLLSGLNPLISISYQLRDAEPFLIDQYLTNGGKSIPKLVLRDEAGNDLLVWGPRPAQCQKIYSKMTDEKADFETVKTELQKWYNQDKGQSFQAELLAALQKLS